MAPSLSHRLAAMSLWNTGELLVFGMLLAFLRWMLPAYPDQPRDQRAAWHDVFYSYLLTVATPFFVAAPISFVAYLQASDLGLAGLPTALGARLGLPGQVLLALVVVDFVSYWRHRLMHTRWLWPIHAIHHSSRRITWLSTERFHLLNHIITSCINIVVVQLLFGPVPTFLSSMMRRGYNFFIHADVRIDYGPLSYLLVSPRFHHWHHARAPEAVDKNYSTFFSLFDWAFGSFYLPVDGSYPERFGERDDIPEELVAQFFHPFRAWAGKHSSALPR